MTGLHLHTYKDIQYHLFKTNRRTTSIYIERDGSISVRAPEPFDQIRIEQVIERKRSWIYKNLAEWQDLNRTKVHREYVNGESFLYLGRNYRLKIVDSQEIPLKLFNGYFLLRKNCVENAPRHFIEFYKEKLQSKINNRINQLASKLGLKPSDVKVMDLQNRWGSCSAKGVLNFHWKCAMLPLSALDYVIVHELAHIENPNHNPTFWRSIEKAMPEYENYKTWLKFNGAGMEL